MKLLVKLNVIILLFVSFGCSEDKKNPNEKTALTVSDISGNMYNTITIGKLTMATTHS